MIRIATFNAENLFSRVLILNKEGKRRDEVDNTPLKQLIAKGLVRVRKTREGQEWITYTRTSISGVAQQNTARVIDALDADVVCLQEVEDLETLRLFNQQVLFPVQKKSHHTPYPYLLLIDGNDKKRFIDVAIMSRFPIGAIRTHIFDRKDNKLVFSRDCLEVEVKTGDDIALNFLINHFKSQIPQFVGGEDQSPIKRGRQATRVAEILKERFESNPRGYFVVAGDLNDEPASPQIAPLINTDSPQLFNVNTESDDGENWTHLYGNKKERFDYLLISQNLRQKLKHVHIERRGISRSRRAYAGERFKTVEGMGTEASDHCGVVASLDI